MAKKKERILSLTKKEKSVKEIKEMISGKKAIKVDIGCGAHKQGPDWVGIDYRPLKGVDIVQDIEQAPWPLPTGCATIAVASHVVEHINPHGGVFIDFMNEVWRILKDGGEFLISTPYAGSPGYWWDPTHVNPLSEMTMEYFDPKGTLTQGGFYGIYAPLPWQVKPGTLTWNDTGNLEVVLVKRPIKDEYHVDQYYLDVLKKNTKATKKYEKK